MTQKWLRCQNKCHIRVQRPRKPYTEISALFKNSFLDRPVVFFWGGGVKEYPFLVSNFDASTPTLDSGDSIPSADSIDDQAYAY